MPPPLHPPPVPPATWLCPHCSPERPRAFVGLPALIRHARRQHKDVLPPPPKPLPKLRRRKA